MDATFAAGTLDLVFGDGSDVATLQVNDADEIEVVSAQNGPVDILVGGSPATVEAKDVDLIRVAGAADDQRFRLDSPISLGRGLTVDAAVEEVELPAGVFTGGPEGVQIEAPLVTLGGDVSTDGAPLSLPNTVVLDGSVELTSERGGDQAAGEITLGAVRAAVAGVRLLVSADGGSAGGADITLGSADGSVPLLRDIRLDAGISGGDIHVNGRARVASTFTVRAADELRLTGDIDAGLAISISNVSSVVQLADGVDLRAFEGDIRASEGVRIIELSGATGVHSVLATGTLSLTRVVETGGSQDLLLRAGFEATLSSVAITGDLSLEVVEPVGPPPAATFVVTNTNDSGPGSFRQAIIDANDRPNGLLPDRIHFQIPGGGVQTIDLESVLPAIVDPVVIDGRTQPGFVNRPLVELNGLGAGPTTNRDSHGLVVLAGESTIRGLIINRFSGDGIQLRNNGNNIVEGNLIGIDPTGTEARRNRANGILITSLSAGNRIGSNFDGLNDELEFNLIGDNRFFAISVEAAGPGQLISGNRLGTDITGTQAVGRSEHGILVRNTPQVRIENNLISGARKDGILLRADRPLIADSVIVGNLIGTNLDATGIIGNGRFGINLRSEAANYTIGGTTLAEANVLGGNLIAGLRVHRPAENNLIVGNFIGVDATGTIPLPNAGDGIHLGDPPPDSDVNGTRIGGLGPGEANTVAFNQGAGILVTGNRTLGNPFSGNRVFGNVGLNIDLVGGVEDAFGVTANDPLDADMGPNQLQNRPQLVSATGDASGLRLTGQLGSVALESFRIEVFAGSALHASGTGEAERLVASFEVQTDASGNTAFDVLLDVAVSDGEFLTATASRLSTGDTSELADGIEVLGTSPGPSPLIFPPPASLAGSSRSAFNLGPERGGPVTLQSNEPFTFQAGDLAASSIVITGQLDSDRRHTFDFRGDVTAQVEFELQRADQLIFRGAVIAPAVNISDVREALRLDRDASLQATQGDLLLSQAQSIAKIELVGVGGTNTLSASGAVVFDQLDEVLAPDVLQIVAGDALTLPALALTNALRVQSGDVIAATGVLEAASVRLDSILGVGNASPVSLRAASVEAFARSSGNIQLENDRDGAVRIERLESTNGGSIAFRQLVAADLTVGRVTTSADGDPSPGEGDVSIRSIGGSLILTDQLSTGGLGTVVVDAGEGILTTTAASDISADSGSITLTARDLVLGGAISGQDELRLRPSDPAQDLAVGENTGNAAWHLDALEVGRLNDGFTRIVIGRPVDGSGTMDVHSITVVDPLLLVAGSIRVQDLRAPGQPVELVARTGNIADGDLATGMDITASSVRLESQTGTGSGGEAGSLELDTPSVTALNHLSSGIFLHASGSTPLTIDAVAEQSGEFAVLGDRVPVTLLRVEAADAALAALAGHTITAIDVSAPVVGLFNLGDADILVDRVAGTQIDVGTGGALLETQSDAEAEFIGGQVRLDAAVAIGSNGAEDPLELDAADTEATSGNGPVLLTSVRAALSRIQARLAGPGRLEVDSVTGPVSLENSLTTDGPIVASVSGHDLSALGVQAAGGPVRLTTVGAGTLQVDDVSADQVFLDAASSIVAGPSARQITADALALRAGAPAGPLATAIGLLSVRAGGGLTLRNQGALEIGSFDGLDGIEATGDVDIETASPLVVTSPIEVVAGNVRLANQGAGDLRMLAPARLSGGDGSLTWETSNDLQLSNTPAAPDYVVEGAGRIVGRAQGSVLVEEGTRLQTSTGNITHVPLIEGETVDVIPLDRGGSNLDGQGTVILSVILGDGVELETNFQIVIDWGDGTIENFPLPGNPDATMTQQFDTGIHRIRHDYRDHPNRDDPSADIPVRLFFRFDAKAGGFQADVNPNGVNGIEFFEGGVSVTTIVDRLLTVPGEGLFSVVAVTEPAEIEVTERNETTATFTPTITIIFVAEAVEEVEVVQSELESVAPDETRLFFTLVDVQGREVTDAFGNRFEKELPLRLLEGNRLFDLFRRFPNGHYRVYLQRGDRLRILYDLYVEQNRLVPAPDDVTALDGETGQEIAEGSGTAHPLDPLPATEAAAVRDGAVAHREPWRDQLQQVFQDRNVRWTGAARTVRRLRTQWLQSLPEGGASDIGSPPGDPTAGTR